MSMGGVGQSRHDEVALALRAELVEEQGYHRERLTCEECGKPLTIDSAYIVNGWVPPGKTYESHPPKLTAWCDKHRDLAGV